MIQGNYEESVDLPYRVGCGGVVVRKASYGYEILCLYRSKEKFGMKGDSYHLPKGTLDADETLEQCALREVLEESGAECEAVAYIGATTSNLQSRDTKYSISYTRHFFLMRCAYLHETHDTEHDHAEWLPVAKAIDELAKLPKDEDKIVQNALAYIEKAQPNL
jgi:8-oxo-dGTP pyrophosphatase MutT (NUDIX family)